MRLDADVVESQDGSNTEDKSPSSSSSAPPHHGGAGAGGGGGSGAAAAVPRVDADGQKRQVLCVCVLYSCACK